MNPRGWRCAGRCATAGFTRASASASATCCVRGRLTRCPRCVHVLRIPAKNIPSPDDFFADFGFLDKKPRDGSDGGKPDKEALAGQTPTKTGASKSLTPVRAWWGTRHRLTPYLTPSRCPRARAPCSGAAPPLPPLLTQLCRVVAVRSWRTSTTISPPRPGAPRKHPKSWRTRATSLRRRRSEEARGE